MFYIFIHLQDIEGDLGLSQSVFVLAGKWVIIVLAIINILREIFQIYQVRFADVYRHNFI